MEKFFDEALPIYIIFVFCTIAVSCTNPKASNQIVEVVTDIDSLHKAHKNLGKNEYTSVNIANIEIVNPLMSE